MRLVDTNNLTYFLSPVGRISPAPQGTLSGSSNGGISSNLLSFEPSGDGPPTVNTRSQGTKIVLWPSLTGAQVDFALGTWSGALWMSVATANGFFRWFGGTSEMMSLSASGLSFYGGIVYMGGGTSNVLLYNSTGIGAPTVNTRSLGTKIVLYPSVGSGSADYGFGIDASTLWSSVPGPSSQFRWYGGTRSWMSLANGVLDVSRELKVNGSSVVGVPIGAIVPWAKSLPGTTALPDGYVECNGQNYTPTGPTLPYWNGGAGVTVPDLNGANGPARRFLRGAPTSGGTGGGTPNHTHAVNCTTTEIGASGTGTTVATGIVNPGETVDTTPDYYEVVYIMRVK